MTRTEKSLTVLATRTGRITRTGDRVSRIATGGGEQYAITDAGGNDVRCVLGRTTAEAKAALVE